MAFATQEIKKDNSTPKVETKKTESSAPVVETKNKKWSLPFIIGGVLILGVTSYLLFKKK
jgi:hypothetical protein